jgi:hypothetical protein
MSSYRIQSGDTLSSLATRFHTTLAALLHANPQIRNPNLIDAGANLNLPGNNDDFVAKKKAYTRGGETKTPDVDTATDAPPAKGSVLAYDAARSVLGQNISSLKYNGPLAKYLDKWPGNNVCCANFVSACLESAGQIKPSEHNDNVRGLANNLSSDSRWSQTSLKNAKPGDVVCFNVPGEGSYSHTVMFAGWKGNQPIFIGSNNANADGTQRITQGPMNYPIAAVFHYHG